MRDADAEVGDAAGPVGLVGRLRDHRLRCIGAAAVIAYRIRRGDDGGNAAEQLLLVDLIDGERPSPSSIKASSA
ncbi:hypothetical protein [Streptomyces sp. SID13031]|uniref:hypothetical protein n=1 Tax=Streptomyces sp. SID13031 TaxID=2706046 RepID=UPI0013CB7B7F|nr:hypothetical protein [Streptomyces sp. SID13031]NEA35512.1 hypothetical protein [Streptomyces sp. SID13031]